MAEFTWLPDADHTKSMEPKVESATFGDGYSQSVPNGINNAPETWQLTFTGPVSEGDAIDAFLKQHAGCYAFDWRTPENVMARFICRKWSKNRTHGVKVVISAEFEQVYGR